MGNRSAWREPNLWGRGRAFRKRSIGGERVAVACLVEALADAPLASACLFLRAAEAATWPAEPEERAKRARHQLVQLLKAVIEKRDPHPIRVQPELQVLVPDVNAALREDAEHLGWVDLSLAVEFENEVVEGQDFPLRSQLLLEAKLDGQVTKLTVRGEELRQPAAYAAAWELVGAESEAVVRMVGTIGIKGDWPKDFQDFFESAVRHRNECRVATTCDFEWLRLVALLETYPPQTDAGVRARNMLAGMIE